LHEPTIEKKKKKQNEQKNSIEEIRMSLQPTMLVEQRLKKLNISVLGGVGQILKKWNRRQSVVHNSKQSLF